jgi:hypothetical protein
MTVKKIVGEVEEFDLASVCLWDIASNVLTDQRVLVSEETLLDSRLVDGQKVLIEFLVKDRDGLGVDVWPRADLLAGASRGGGGNNELGDENSGRRKEL